jgi:ABC-2 type transport system ATP-binding protein
MDGTQVGIGTQAGIEVDGLRKRFGGTQALDGMSFTVQPGRVTGFVGPNGAGKSTTMRVVLGLDAPDSGRALVGGRPYRSLTEPLRRLGSLLDAGALQPSPSARNHLLWLAHTQGLPAARVDHVLARVGLTDAARRRAGGFSLGMRQRLGIAAALLRAPRLLVLDEPANGLDPAGMRAMRSLVRELGADGMTVLLSSHNMAEVEELCDTVTIMRSGRVVHRGAVDELRGQAPDPAHQLLTSDDERALELARDRHGVRAEPHTDGGLAVRARQEELDAYVLALAADRIAVRALRLEATPLESLFFRLTEGEPAEPAVPAAGEGQA